MKPDAEFRITFAELQQIVQEAGRPTTGKLAGFVWELCSSQRLSGHDGAEVYRALGYQPFKGYPLKRA